jgi:hypothetical protein
MQARPVEISKERVKMRPAAFHDAGALLLVTTAPRPLTNMMMRTVGH